MHQAGVPADMDAVHALCDPRGSRSSRTPPARSARRYRGRAVGAHSDLVVFSFHPRKVITTGEGGMLMTDRADWADAPRRLREHGMNLSAAERHASGDAVLEHYLELGSTTA